MIPRKLKEYIIAYHPEANQQAESTNKILIYNLKKHLEAAKGRWPEELLRVWWAYRTTTKTSTVKTPSSLIYRAKALIPIEIEESSLRDARAREDSNKEALRENFDLTGGHRGMALICMTAQK